MASDIQMRDETQPQVKVCAPVPEARGVERPLRISLHERPESLDCFEAAWIELAGDVPFRRPDWCLTWWRHYAEPGDRLYVLTASDESGQLVGVAPFYVRHRLAAGRELRFLGDGEICSDYLSLVAGDDAPALARGVGRWLLETGARDWDVAVLGGVAADDVTMAELARTCAERGCLVDVHEHARCWRVEFPPTWEDFLRGLSKSRRAKIRQFARKQFDSGRATWHLAEDAESVAAGWKIFVELHQKRRRSLGEPGCFSSPRFAAFHRELIESWAPQKLARLFWTSLDGRPVAVEYDLLGHKTAYLYQAGMEPECSQESPGTLGTIVALRSALEGGYAAFDFLRGDEDYKTHWRTVARPLVEYRLTPDRLAARARRQLRRTALDAKKWLKKRLRPENPPQG